LRAAKNSDKVFCHFTVWGGGTSPDFFTYIPEWGGGVSGGAGGGKRGPVVRRGAKRGGACVFRGGTTLRWAWGSLFNGRFVRASYKKVSTKGGGHRDEQMGPGRAQER